MRAADLAIWALERRGEGRASKVMERSPSGVDAAGHRRCPTVLAGELGLGKEKANRGSVLGQIWTTVVTAMLLSWPSEADYYAIYAENLRQSRPFCETAPRIGSF